MDDIGVNISLDVITENQIVDSVSKRILVGLRYFLENPSFITVNKTSNASFIELVTAAGPDHETLKITTQTTLNQLCASILPEYAVRSEVDIIESDIDDNFTVKINIYGDNNTPIIEMHTVSVSDDGIKII
ncbi:MAG: hypothetical protein GY804_09245 [Alphaproteobacteria bacterium]|nr:hypothetical protein [Alphaproteobacteria bacterium]